MGKAGRETARAMEAFEYYYLLGFDRSLARVADEMGISLPTVTKWSTKYNWVERVQKRDEKNMRLVAYADDKAYVESMRNYKKLVTASVKKYYEALTKGKVVINNVKDLDKLIRLDLELSDRINTNDSDKLASYQKSTVADSLEVILSSIKGEMEEAKENAEDETDDAFGSVTDLIDEDDDQE